MRGLFSFLCVHVRVRMHACAFTLHSASRRARMSAGGPTDRAAAQDYTGSWRSNKIEKPAHKSILCSQPGRCYVFSQQSECMHGDSRWWKFRINSMHCILRVSVLSEEDVACSPEKLSAAPVAIDLQLRSEAVSCSPSSSTVSLFWQTLQKQGQPQPWIKHRLQD